MFLLFRRPEFTPQLKKPQSNRYDKTIDQLEGFLEALANEGKLECSGGAYSIAKK
jgi:hypothetical protein